MTRGGGDGMIFFRPFGALGFWVLFTGGLHLWLLFLRPCGTCCYPIARAQGFQYIAPSELIKENRVGKQVTHPTRLIKENRVGKQVTHPTRLDSCLRRNDTRGQE